MRVTIHYQVPKCAPIFSPVLPITSISSSIIDCLYSVLLGHATQIRNQPLCSVHSTDVGLNPEWTLSDGEHHR